jgi:hypothetical protein
MMILLMVVKYSPNSYLACQIGQLCPVDFINARATQPFTRTGALAFKATYCTA